MNINVFIAIGIIKKNVSGMEIKINLSNEDIDKLLKKYCYNRGKVAVYYNRYGDDEELFKYGEEGVHLYFAEVAWIGDKPDCLCVKYPTMETIKDYLLEKVVNTCFMKSLMEALVPL